MVTPGARSNSIVQPVTEVDVGLATTYLSSHHEPLSAALKAAERPAAACAGSGVATSTPRASSAAAGSTRQDWRFGRVPAIMVASGSSVNFVNYLTGDPLRCQSSDIDICRNPSTPAGKRRWGTGEAGGSGGSGIGGAVRPRPAAARPDPLHGRRPRRLLQRHRLEPHADPRVLDHPATPRPAARADLLADLPVRQHARAGPPVLPRVRRGGVLLRGR